MNKNFYYDPLRQGYDTSDWKSITGTPTIVATGLRVSSATTVGQADIYSGEVTMAVTCPVAPEAGQDKQFGLAQVSLGSFVGFKMSGTKFYYESVDPNGITTTVEITWDALWTASSTIFKIVWNNHNVEFWIASNKIATLNWSNVPTVGGLNTHFPLSFYAKNANADNLDIKYIEVRDAVMYNKYMKADVTLDVGDIEIGAVELKNAADDTRAIINAANTGRANTDPVLVTQLVDATGLVNTVSSNVISPSTLTAGETFVAISGTRVALGALLATKSIYIRAKATNTGDVYVGDTNVDATTSRQVVLSPDSAINIDISNRASIFVDAAIGGGTEGVDYLCQS